MRAGGCRNLRDRTISTSFPRGSGGNLGECAAELKLRRSRVLLAGTQWRYAVNFNYKSFKYPVDLQNQSKVAPFSAYVAIIVAIIVAILRRFNAAQTRFHSACALSYPRMLNCLNPGTLFIQALGGSDNHFRFR